MTIAFVVLVLVAMLGIAALAVDLGVLYTARTSSQNASDAAALAGAATFVKDQGKPQPETAQGAAVAVATQSAILGSPILSANVTTNVDTVNHRVKVTISRPVTTFFGKVLGLMSANVQTAATAEASLTGTGAAKCVKPIFIPNTVLAPDADYDTACSQGHVIFNPDGTLSTWVQQQGFFTTAGCNNFVTIRPVDSSKALVPSQYYSIDFGSGGNTYRCSIASCLNDPSCGVDQTILDNYALACNKSVNLPTENGGLDGPTKQGVDDLVSEKPTTYDVSGNTMYNSSHVPVSDSPQDSSVPVWNNCEAGNQIGSGKESFHVVGLARVFITGYGNGSDPNPDNSECKVTGGGGGKGQGGGVNKPGVQAWIRDAFPCGATGTGTDTTPSSAGPFAYPIRLIQNQ